MVTPDIRTFKFNNDSIISSLRDLHGIGSCFYQYSVPTGLGVSDFEIISLMIETDKNG
jgi:hypothetical protein